MAGAQIATSVTILNSLLGYQAISLTNFATSAQSLIAAGSKVEVAGGFFTFASAETPVASSWTACGTGNTCYICVIPAGTAGSQTITAEYTDTAPVWSTSKQGWYASAGSLTRYVGGVTKTSPTQYDDAFLIYGKQADAADEGIFYSLKVREDITVGEYVNGDVDGRRKVAAFNFESGVTEGSAYTAIVAVIGTASRTVSASGYIDPGGGGTTATVVASVQYNPSGGGSVDIHGTDVSGWSIDTYQIRAGGATTIQAMRLYI